MKHIAYKLTAVLLCCVVLFVVFSCEENIGDTYDYRPHIDGKNSDSIAMREDYFQNLEILGRVWGFVKYHHPAVNSGEFDIDKALFNLIPAITACNREECNKILLEWINSLGEYKYRLKSYKPSPGDVMYSFDWIEDIESLDIGLSDELRRLRYAKRGRNKYISQIGIGVPVFKEKDYKDEEIDRKHRLLCLFRYWNIIEYFYPYKQLLKYDWDAVLSEYIPKFFNCATEDEYIILIRELAARLNDSHAKTTEIVGRGERMLPLSAKIIDGELIISDRSPYSSKNQTGLLPGDRILRIDNKSSEELFAHCRDSLQIPASNQSVFLREVAFYSLCTNREKVDITYERGGKIYEATLHTLTLQEAKNLYEESNKTPSSLVGMDSSIAYIDAGTFKSDENTASLLNNYKTIIIDARGYPYNYSTLFFLQRYFAPGNVFAKFHIPIINSPGRFKTQKQHAVLGNIFTRKRDVFKGGVIVLVNEFTQSRGEYLVMSLQSSNNTIVIGSQTAGTNGDITIVDLPGGIRSYISGIGVYYPDDSVMQQAGVKIDYHIEETREDVINRIDPLLRKAIEIAIK